MQQSFLPDSVKCRNLFDGEEDVYKIPRYQRPYSWEETHINQLLDDLYEAWEKERDSPYFLGSIILVDEPGEERLSLLDGQQRVTTLTILYAVFKDQFEESLSDSNKVRVQERLTDQAEGKPRLRSDKQADLELSVLDEIRLDDDNRYTRAAETVIDNLEEKFGDDHDDLNDFFQYVDRNIELIRIDTSDLGHAVRLFQTINTRGKDLTVSDLTKSYLLSNLEHDEDKDDVIEVWQEITNKIDDDYDELDDILGMYRLYLREAKAQETAYEELKSEFDGQDPKAIVRDLRDFVGEYISLGSASDRWIFMLDNLYHELYWKTILISASKDEVEFYDELKKELVAFYYSYWIGDYTAEKIKNPSIEILQKLKEGKGIDEIRSFIQDKRESDSITQRVRDALNSDDVYHESWHDKLLIAIEYRMSTWQKIERIESNQELHIEHILPRKFESAKSTHPYWGEMFDELEAERLKHSLGNLTPLQYDLNSAVAQKPFPDKVEIYKGNEDKPRSSFDLTLRVADSDNYQDWSPEEIEDNKSYLLEKSAELLKLPRSEIAVSG